MAAKKVSVFNSDGTNQRATVIVGMGFRGSDGELYVADGDEATGGINVNAVLTPVALQDVNVTQVGSTTINLGYGSPVTGSQRVVANISVAGAAVAAGNPVHITPGTGAVFAISAASLPLPTGASTSALQTTGNTSLSSIDTKLTSQATSALQGTGNTSLSSIDTKLTNNATATLQTAGNTSLSSIDTKLTSQATGARQDAQTALLSSIEAHTDAIDVTVGSINSKLVQQALGAGSVLTSPRVFAISGNVAGAADFNAGITGAQTARVTANITRNGTELSYGAGASDANSQRVQLANESLPGRGATAVQITSATILPYILDTSSTAITSAFSLVVASTPADINRIEVFNGSGTPIYLATGAASSEVVQYIIPPGGSSSQISLRIPSGSRLSIRAFTGTINSGYFIMNFGG